MIVYNIYTMSFIRRIKKKDAVYLAEVENQWIDGKCVQRHIRYVGKQVDGETRLSSSISDAEITDVKIHGPLLVLNHLAEELDLSGMLGEYGEEILSLVYAHCLDYKSINQMEKWFGRTDLNAMLDLEALTEKRLLDALDSLEAADPELLQKRIFERVKEKYRLKPDGIIYDVTNTYLYGKKCPLGKPGKDKDGVKGRPLIQIGLGVTRNEGIPVFHKTFDGNVHDARTLQDMITLFGRYKIGRGMIIYDRGIVSKKNIMDMKRLHWDTLCGLPIKGNLKPLARKHTAGGKMIHLDNRVKLNKTVFYVVTLPYDMQGVQGALALCFNEQRQRDIRESRYDEILNAQQLLMQKKSIKRGLEKYFLGDGRLNKKQIAEAEEFDGVSCMFSTVPLTKEEFVRLYLGNKDVVEKAFRSLKGVTHLQPIRHWLYNRVVAHVFICYLAFLLLSLLKTRLKKLDMSPEQALDELETMYKVYMRDKRKGFKVSRVVMLTKSQELILKTINKKLLKS